MRKKNENIVGFRSVSDIFKSNRRDAYLTCWAHAGGGAYILLCRLFVYRCRINYFSLLFYYSHVLFSKRSTRPPPTIPSRKLTVIARGPLAVSYRPVIGFRWPREIVSYIIIHRIYSILILEISNFSYKLLIRPTIRSNFDMFNRLKRSGGNRHTDICTKNDTADTVTLYILKRYRYRDGDIFNKLAPYTNEHYNFPAWIRPNSKTSQLFLLLLLRVYNVQTQVIITPFIEIIRIYSRTVALYIL